MHLAESLFPKETVIKVNTDSLVNKAPFIPGGIQSAALAGRSLIIQNAARTPRQKYLFVKKMEAMAPSQRLCRRRLRRVQVGVASEFAQTSRQMFRHNLRFFHFLGVLKCCHVNIFEEAVCKIHQNKDLETSF